MAILGTIKTDRFIASPALVISSMLVFCSVLRVEVPPNDDIAVVTLPCERMFNWSASS